MIAFSGGHAQRMHATASVARQRWCGYCVVGDGVVVVVVFPTVAGSGELNLTSRCHNKGHTHDARGSRDA